MQEEGVSEEGRAPGEQAGVEAVARDPSTPPRLGGHPTPDRRGLRRWEIPRQEPAELLRRAARPPPASPGARGEAGRGGRGCTGGHGTASALERVQRVEALEAAACSPLCLAMHRQNAEQSLSPCSTSSLLCSHPVSPAEPSW